MLQENKIQTYDLATFYKQMDQNNITRATSKYCGGHKRGDIIGKRPVHDSMYLSCHHRRSSQSRRHH